MGYQEIKDSTWLIHRIIPIDDGSGNGKGIDAWFRFDYMGSSEFEFGTLPHSVRLMRAQGDNIGIFPLKVYIEGEAYTAFYVGRKNEVPTAQAIFSDQLLPRDSRQLRFKERTEIDRAYGLDRWSSTCQVSGWVAVQMRHVRRYSWVPFAFFKDEKHAVKWLELLTKKGADEDE